MYKYSYALEKFSRAIYNLATDEQEIRKRLLLVFSGDLSIITIEHLPQKLHEDFKWIQTEISKYSESYSGESKIFDKYSETLGQHRPTPIEATLSRIRKRTAVPIARKIFHIWSVLDEDSRINKNI